MSLFFSLLFLKESDFERRSEERKSEFPTLQTMYQKQIKYMKKSSIFLYKT